MIVTLSQSQSQNLPSIGHVDMTGQHKPTPPSVEGASSLARRQAAFDCFHIIVSTFADFDPK
jgi:hypothetical protein